MHPDGEQVTDATMQAAAAARRRAGDRVTPEALSALIAQAARRKDLSPEQVDALTAHAIRLSDQVSYLLGKLAGLGVDEAGGSHA